MDRTVTALVRIPCRVLPIVAILACCACRENQSAAEERAVIDITRALKWFRLESPSVTVTNLVQVLNPGNVYARSLHETFKHFGRNAGFRNSIYEKYAFFPPGITNAVGLEGTKLVMMNAQPFPNREGMKRYVVMNGGDRYGYTLMPEWQVKGMLNDLGLPEPKVTPMPPPPPIPAGFQDQYRESLAIKREKFFGGLAQLLGLSHTAGPVIALALSSVAALAILAGWWCLRRRRRNRSMADSHNP